MADKYGPGPDSGSTPADDSDLHDNSNPFAGGSPRLDGHGTTGHFSVAGYGGGAMGQYYDNPTVDSHNPYSAGVPEDDSAATSYVMGGLSTDISQAHDYQRGGGSGGDPSDVNFDEGFGKDGQGRS